MRILTFSVLKKCAFRCFRQELPKKYSGIRREIQGPKIIGDPSLIEICPSWKEGEEVQLRESFLRDMQVLPDFISEQEEAALLAELDPYLKRMRYEFDHWDNAIQGYRETERSVWRPENEAVLRRVRELAFVGHEPLPHAHVLDLAAAGFIRPHVDAVRFCGDVIAGVCLMSSAVMRLQHEAPARAHVAAHALLQRRALYVMRGVARYEFSHAVLGGGGGEGGDAGARSAWRGAGVPRARRVAVICRSKPTRTE